MMDSVYRTTTDFDTVSTNEQSTRYDFDVSGAVETSTHRTDDR